jgi:KUP system potassium uptake protein
MIMKTWRDGRAILIKRITRSLVPASHLVDEVKRGKIVRVPGIGVFLSSSSDGLPLVLLHHLKHNKVFHAQVVLLSVVSKPVPYIDASKRVVVESLGAGFWRLRAYYGFMDSPKIKDIMAGARTFGLDCPTISTSYFLGREQLLPNGPSRMSTWRKKLFILMSRNARSATAFFEIPPGRVVELGTQIEI